MISILILALLFALILPGQQNTGLDQVHEKFSEARTTLNGHSSAIPQPKHQ